MSMGNSDRKIDGLLSHWASLTQPLPDPPHIAKVDARTGDVVYDNPLALNFGKAAIAAVAHHENWVVVGGITNGKGVAFGESTTGSDDWDGFVAFLDSDSGQVVDSTRMESQANKDDFVRGLCVHDGDLYVVGTTTGWFEGIHSHGVFLVKMKLYDRSTVWRKQYHAGMEQVQGLGCAVSDNHVYVGGNTAFDLINTQVQFLASETEDAFVTAVDIISGDEIWTQHLDTSLKQGDNRDDMFIEIQVNPDDGHPYVLLNSMNHEKQLNDVFLVSLDPDDGTHELLEGAIDDEKLGEDSNLGNDVSGNGGDNNGGGGSWPSTPSTEDDSVDQAIVIAAIVIPVLLFVLVFGSQYCMNRNDIEAVRKRSTPNLEEDEEPEHEIL